MRALLDDAVDSLRDEVAQNTKRYQSSCNGEEPVQVLDVLTRHDAV